MAKKKIQLSQETKEQIEKLKEEYLKETDLLDRYFDEDSKLTPEEMANFNPYEAAQRQNDAVLRMFDLYYTGNLADRTIGKRMGRIRMFLIYSNKTQSYLPGALCEDNFSDYYGNWYGFHVMNSSVQSARSSIAAMKNLMDMFVDLELMKAEDRDDIEKLIKSEQTFWLMSM